jgi:hypothetical protein
MLIFILDTSADEQRVERLRDAKDDERRYRLLEDESALFV